MIGRWAKPLALIITAGILVAIYMHIDVGLLTKYLVNIHPLYFAGALSLFLPQILVTSFRWHVMIRGFYPTTFTNSIQLVMAGKALNALVPSKLGEMSKAYFLKREGKVNTGQSVSVVVLEKILDLGGLCAVLTAGVLLARVSWEIMWIGAGLGATVLIGLALLLLVPLKKLGEKMQQWSRRMGWIGNLLIGWDCVVGDWKARGRAGLPAILGLSVLLWCLHVLQIYLFFPSLGDPVPVAVAMANIPLAIFVGLLPLTIGGMGTRDSALIILFAPYADAAFMAGIGLLCSMRYWVDTLLGVPFFHRYAGRIEEREEAK